MSETLNIPPKSEAFQFILIALHDWADLPRRIAVVQNLLDAAGFDAQATCAPEFKQLWPGPCIGTEAKEASKWLEKITTNLPVPPPDKPEEKNSWVTRDQVKYISEEIHWQRDVRGLNTPKG